MALTKNSLLSLMPTIVGIVVSIVTVPLYIQIIGGERYGAFLIALTFLVYFGQADFGLGRAVTQRLAMARKADPVERSSIVWSALAGAAGISAVGAVLIYGASVAFFGNFFEADAVIKAEALESSWIFALCVPVIMATGVSSGAMVGLERFGVASVGNMIGNVLSQVLPLVMGLLYSVEIKWLLAALLAGRLIGLLPVVISMWAVFLKGYPKLISVDQMKHLFSFGVWIMITAIVGPIMTMFDRVVIGAEIGAAAVVVYSVPFIIAQRTASFPLAIVQALFPRLASQSKEDSLALGKASAVVVGQLYAFLVVGLICLAAPLLQLWLGDELDPRSVLIGQIALIGFWVNALANVPYALIQARGDARFTALLHLVELPLYFAMLYGFGTAYGLYGIAVAFALRAGLDCAVLLWKANFGGGEVIWRLIGPALIISVALVMSSVVVDWLSGIALATVCCLALVGFTWFQMPALIKARLFPRNQGSWP